MENEFLALAVLPPRTMLEISFAHCVQVTPPACPYIRVPKDLIELAIDICVFTLIGGRSRHAEVKEESSSPPPLLTF